MSTFNYGAPISFQTTWSKIPRHWSAPWSCFCSESPLTGLEDIGFLFPGSILIQQSMGFPDSHKSGAGAVWHWCVHHSHCCWGGLWVYRPSVVALSLCSEPETFQLCQSHCQHTQIIPVLLKGNLIVLYLNIPLCSRHLQLLEMSSSKGTS